MSYKKKVMILLAGSIVLLIGVLVLHEVLSGLPCRALHQHGFSFDITGGVSSTFDHVDFFFKTADDTEKQWPILSVSGGNLRVTCRDIDDDGVAEFVVHSDGDETNYQTILKVDLNSGKYHVYSTKGLKVNYPEEGYHFL